MKFDYLTDESEKSLAPFFSPFMISVTCNSVLVIGLLVVLFWPWQDFVSFMSKNKTPFVFFPIFTATLIINSYVNLRCGRGEMVKTRYYATYYGEGETITLEKERDFFRYGLIAFLLHTLLLFFPMLPLVILATSLSGLSLSVLFMACSVVLTASLVCRMFGFLLYLFWGRFSTLGYLLSRIFWFTVIFVTALLIPAINPIVVIYELNKDLGIYVLNTSLYDIATSLQRIGLPSINSYVLYIGTWMLVMILVGITSQILIKRHKRLTIED